MGPSVSVARVERRGEAYVEPIVMDGLSGRISRCVQLGIGRKSRSDSFLQRHDGRVSRALKWEETRRIHHRVEVGHIPMVRCACRVPGRPIYRVDFSSEACERVREREEAKEEVGKCACCRLRAGADREDAVVCKLS